MFNRIIIFSCLLISTLQAYSQSNLRDTSFKVETGFVKVSNSAMLTSLLPMKDSTVLVGGFFDSYKGQSSNAYFVKLDNSANAVAFTNPVSLDNIVYCIDTTADGGILLGGDFSFLNSVFVSPRFIKIDTAGNLFPNWNPMGTGANATVRTMLQQPDGKIYIGGNFDSYNLKASKKIARLFADGSYDSTFVVGNGFAGGTVTAVWAMALQADGKLVVAGEFTTYNDTAANRIVRINNDGSIDTAFHPSANLTINAMKMQADGKLIIGGLFTNVNGWAVNRMTRLNTDGSLDSANFKVGTGFGGQVSAIVVQDDGKILAGGGFSVYNGTNCRRMARLDSNGTLDLTLDMTVNANAFGGSPNNVTVIALQDDGKILAGGNFGTYAGAASNRLVRIMGNYNSVPVKWLYAKGKIENKQAHISWATAQESNNSHFDVQYSKDAVNFETIGIVKGNGNTSNISVYHFTQTSAVVNGYYRIKQTDFNGAFDYSKTFRLDASAETSFELYPNPASSQVVAAGEGKVFVYDMKGALVAEGNANEPIDIAHLERGIYIVKSGDAVKKLIRN